MVRCHVLVTKNVYYSILFCYLIENSEYYNDIFSFAWVGIWLTFNHRFTFITWYPCEKRKRKIYANCPLLTGSMKAYWTNNKWTNGMEKNTKIVYLDYVYWYRRRRIKWNANVISKWNKPPTKYDLILVILSEKFLFQFCS